MTDPHAMQDLIAKNFQRSNDATKEDAAALSQTPALPSDAEVAADTKPADHVVLDMHNMKERLDEKRASAPQSRAAEQISEKKLHPFVIAAIILSLAALLASYEYLGTGQTPI